MTKNLTVGNPALLILAFTMPLLIGNLFQQFYSMADTFIVGNTIGVNALAAVGCTGSIIFLILGFIFGFTAGTSIITAQRFGAGDMAGVRRSFAASLVLGIILTIIITAVSVVAARPLLVALRTPEEILEDARLYIMIIFWGSGAVVLFNIFSSVMRAVGDSRTPLIFLVIACIINIILDYLFILGFRMGVEGAAIATVIAQLIAGLLCIPVIIKKLPMLALTGADWKVSGVELKEHIRVALPMGFQMSIIAIGVVALQFALNGLGTTAVAAFTAAQKIDQFAGMPLNSFGAAMSTYTAQNYGARRIDRIRNGVIQCFLMTAVFSILIGVLFILTGTYLAAIFIGSNPEAVALAHTYLVITSCFYILLAFLLIIRQTLQGLGDSLFPTLAGIAELVMRMFAAITLSQFFGFTGLCFANPLAWFGACIPLGIAFILAMKKLNRQILAEKKQQARN
ncbi:MATE family efflux transporter [Spirochaetia bacterium]|nr:MATE family efflux transporter [Spirochaetia bacterium]